MTAAELAEVERRVIAEIRANHGAEVRHMDMQEALDFGAMALFGEKYCERVRVLRMGDTSTEQCGGTHVSRTGYIRLFKIVSDALCPAGVRLIEALPLTGAPYPVSHSQRGTGASGSMLVVTSTGGG